MLYVCLEFDIFVFTTLYHSYQSHQLYLYYTHYTIYMIQPILPTSPAHLLMPLDQTSHPSTTYFCGCGTLMDDKQHFKAHFITQHQGNFIKGSSHYLTLYTQLVLPVKNWKKVHVSSKSLYLSAEGAKEQNTQKVSTKILSESRLRNSNRKKSQNKTMKLNNSRGKAEPVPKNQSCLRQNSNISRSVSKKKKPIEWNGFLLIPNQNEHKSDFFCGKCQKQFLAPQQFVMHCFQQCQQLQNPRSSHRIQIQNESRYLTAQDSSHYQAGNRRNINIPVLKQVRRMIRVINKQYEPFVCGCGHVQKSKHQNNHVMLNHAEIVPEKSSHIFLRAFKSIRHVIYLKLRTDSKNDGRLWACPCKPLKIMQTQPFVKHIWKVHKGISPMYQ